MLLSCRYLSRSAALSLQSVKLLSDTVPNDKHRPLFPEEARKKVFNRKPNSDRQMQRFREFRKDINRFASERNTDELEFLIQKYIAENPNCHHISSANFRQLSTPFAINGDIDKCKQIIDLFEHLSKFKSRAPGTDILNARIRANYMFSIMNCQDKDKAVKEIKVYLDENKANITRLHPLLLEAISKVLRSLALFTELEELMTSLQNYKLPVPPSAILSLASHHLYVGDKDKALETLQSGHDRSSVDLTLMNDDHFAQLAYLYTQLLPTPAYIELDKFLAISQTDVSFKKFVHFSMPVAGHSTICKNYELVLSVAAERKDSKIFRIICGRNGLFRNLEHVSCGEYVDMTRYIVEVCQHYNISIDVKFGGHILFGLLKVGGYENIDYKHFRELRNILKMHPLTEYNWRKVIKCVPAKQAILVYNDLFKIGLMSDELYTEFFLRSKPSPSDPLFMELQSLRHHYNLTLPNPLPSTTDKAA